MSHRSVIETLDLHDDYEDYRNEGCASQNCGGWMSPRISFSTDFISAQAEKASPEKQKREENYSTDFEFTMSSFNIFDTVSQGYIVPADELFHKGKLLPGYIPPCSAVKDLAGGVEAVLPERIADCPVTIATCPVTIARHLNGEPGSSSSSLGCVLGPSCVRTPKGPKWRELFGALRRVKSDSGRQRIPDESLLPPKAIHNRKKFFKHFFSSGSHVPQDGKATAVASSSPCVNRSACSGASAVLATQERNLPCDSASAASAFVPRASSGSSSHSVGDSKEKSRGLHSSQSSSTEAPARGEHRSDLRGKSFEQSRQGADDFSFNPIPNRVLSRSGSGSSGRSSPMRVPARKMDRPQTASLIRSASGRVIVRGLDRGSGSGKNSTSFQEQARALRSREIRRSPDRSGYSVNVRVTPVLNVPVCMGPVLRGACKSGKGRLSNFRSLLTFKSKLPTPLSTPIATR